jgi:glycerophosphoryl diester phosphodiesterase
VIEHHPFAGSLFRRSSAPLVVGHRGLPRLHQENTLAGFRRAVELGIPAVELDVHLSRDGRAVCVHDQQLERLTGVRANVRDLTWDQLSRLRVRRELPMGIDGKGAPVLARYEREEPIALLEEVLHEIAAPIALNIELKLDLERRWHTGVGEVAARGIAGAGATDRVIVSSFDPRKLRAALRVHPALQVGFCFDDGMLGFAAPWLEWLGGLTRAAEATAAPADRQLLTRALEAHLVGRLLPSRMVAGEHTLLTEHTARRLHQRGVALGTHTLFPLGSTTGKPIDPAADQPAELERLVAMGVDWIETDDPSQALELLARRR